MKEAMRSILIVIIIYLIALVPLLFAVFLKEKAVRENEKYIGERGVLGKDTVVVVCVSYQHVKLSNDAIVSIDFGILQSKINETIHNARADCQTD